MGNLNVEQLRQLAGFTSNLGIVFTAAVFTPLFSQNVDAITPNVIILGLLGAVLALSLSLLILGGIKR